MSMHRPMMMKLIVAGTLVFSVTAQGITEERAALPKPAGAATALANKGEGFGQDPFVGDYAGTFHPLGTYDAKAKAGESKDFKPQKCGNCHAEATVARTKDGYSLTLVVFKGKDKDGKSNKQQFVLKAEQRADKLSFRNERYSIAMEKGEATGERTGRMKAEIKLKRNNEKQQPDKGHAANP